MIPSQRARMGSCSPDFSPEGKLGKELQPPPQQAPHLQPEFTKPRCTTEKRPHFCCLPSSVLGTSLWTGEHLQQQLLHDSQLKGQKAAGVLLPCLYLVLWGQTWYFRSKSFPVVFSSQIPTVRTSNQHPPSPGRTNPCF